MSQNIANESKTKLKEIEKKLWNASDSLRGSMSSEEYQHVIIGILVLKYINDKFIIAIKKVEARGITIDLLDREIFYNVHHAFIVPDKSKWSYLEEYTSEASIGQKIDKAFNLLENENPILKGIFYKNYNRQEFDQNKIGEVIKIFSEDNLATLEEDFISKVYEYFLGKFFRDRGKSGGEFYTPKSIVRLMVNLLKPMKGKIYDPCCGTGGILVQIKRFLEDHNGNQKNISVFGQEYNSNTWKLAKLNLILNGFPLKDTQGNFVLGERHADTFTNDQHRQRKFDYVMANPPFNVSKWSYDKLINDPRWKWGVPPKGNANMAWVSHILARLSFNGKAAIILGEGSLSSEQKNEKEIRKNLIEANKVDAIIQLPGKLFYTTGISASIWILNNDKKNSNVLMIYAYNIDTKMLSKKFCELTETNIQKISRLYDKHLDNQIINELDFAKSVTKEEIIKENYDFVAGYYIDSKEEIINHQKLKNDIKLELKNLDKLFKELNDIKTKLDQEYQKEDE